MAAAGLKPFCAIYSTFLQRGYDQVLHDVAIQNLPVRFFMDRAGLVGDDGPTHHGTFDTAFLAHIPNMVLLAPRDTTELREMTHWMKDYSAHPSAVRYPRGGDAEGLPEGRTPIVFGRAETLCSGEDLTILASGSMVGPAMQAAKVLSDEGIYATVINARFIKPFDSETIFASARETSRLLIVEEGSRIGGLGQMVRDAMWDAGLTDVKTDILAIPDHFVEHGSQPQIRGPLGLDAAGIAARARDLVKVSVGGSGAGDRVR